MKIYPYYKNFEKRSFSIDLNYCKIFNNGLTVTKDNIPYRYDLNNIYYFTPQFSYKFIGKETGGNASRFKYNRIADLEFTIGYRITDVKPLFYDTPYDAEIEKTLNNYFKSGPVVGFSFAYFITTEKNKDRKLK